MDRSPRHLLITHALSDPPQGGRELLCRLNQETLRDLLEPDLTVFHLQRRRVRVSPIGLVRALHGYIDGVGKQAISDVVKIIDKERISAVFIDGSNLGELAKQIRRARKDVRVTVFFHNVEAVFFWHAIRNRMSARAFAVLLVNYLAERKSVRYSDIRLCLSGRDDRLLARLYGRGATHIVPMAMRDRQVVQSEADTAPPEGDFALFVGGAFYANIEGLLWYARHVAPLVDIPVYAVGRGLEVCRGHLGNATKVHVVGAVDELSSWYSRAKFVVAPILSGSGMKTKVAEALMHGKRVVGTTEAFCGYEGGGSLVNWVCETAGEFAAAMNEAHASIDHAFDPRMREIYLDQYSEAAHKRRLADLIAAHLTPGSLLGDRT